VAVGTGWAESEWGKVFVVVSTEGCGAKQNRRLIPAGFVAFGLLPPSWGLAAACVVILPLTLLLVLPLFLRALATPD
jgi:hypothetical protein